MVAVAISAHLEGGASVVETSLVGFEVCSPRGEWLPVDVSLLSALGTDEGSLYSRIDDAVRGSAAVQESIQGLFSYTHLSLVAMSLSIDDMKLLLACKAQTRPGTTAPSSGSMRQATFEATLKTLRAVLGPETMPACDKASPGWAFDTPYGPAEVYHYSAYAWGDHCDELYGTVVWSVGACNPQAATAAVAYIQARLATAPAGL